jgi:hypothetical protein
MMEELHAKVSLVDANPGLVEAGRWFGGGLGGQLGSGGLEHQFYVGRDRCSGGRCWCSQIGSMLILEVGLRVTVAVFLFFQATVRKKLK